MKSSKTNALDVSVRVTLELLITLFYIFSTLVPNSHNLIVLFPLIWQIGLFLPLLLLLWLLWKRKIYLLGNGFDRLIGIIFFALTLSTIFARFRDRAIWYSGSVFCFLTTIYVLNYYLSTTKNRYKFLTRQGYLNIAFISISLFLWIKNNIIPKWNDIQELTTNGINIASNLSILDLGNSQPIGHQNYIAGYLLLSLPLLVGLSLIDRGWRRFVWCISIFLGLFTLYTTNSQGGWLGLEITLILSIIFILCFKSLSNLWLIFGSIGSLLLIYGSIFINSRLLKIIRDFVLGNSGNELLNRYLNGVVAYLMGIDRPFTGVGLGGIPLLYQKYRPFWAGRELPFVDRFLSTPFQLWAELGIWSIILFLFTIALLLFTISKLLRNRKNLVKSDRIFTCSILASFLGYATISLVDYQLDNICISGTLILFIASLNRIIDTSLYPVSYSYNSLTSEFESQTEPLSRSFPIKPQTISLIIAGFSIAFFIWLIPIHRAWFVSTKGFNALANNDVPNFTKHLTKANSLVPWEANYSYQLGWNLGYLSQNTEDKDRQLSQSAIQWFKKANNVSPYLEIGYSNLGWLLLDNNPLEATKNFQRSSQLFPAKKYIFFGLGSSLLKQQKKESAIQAFTIELLRNPLFITSPVWQDKQLNVLFPNILNNLESIYTKWIQEDPDNAMWYQYRGGIYWWNNNLELAFNDWSQYGTTWQKLILNINSESELITFLNNIPESPQSLVLKAWFDPQERSNLLQKAWLLKNNKPFPRSLLNKTIDTMNNYDTLESWLRSNDIIYSSSLDLSNFNNPHLDDLIPTDIYANFPHTALNIWFDLLYDSPSYNPILDKAIQPLRINLFQRINIKLSRLAISL